MTVGMRKETTARELGEGGMIPQIRYMKDELQVLEGPQLQALGWGGGEEWALALQLPNRPACFHPNRAMGPGADSTLIRFMEETKLGDV